MSAALEKSLDEIIGEAPKQPRRSGGPTRSSGRSSDTRRPSGGGSGGRSSGGRHPGRVAGAPYARESRRRSRSYSPRRDRDDGRWVHDRAERDDRSRSRSRGQRGGSGRPGAYSIKVERLPDDLEANEIRGIFDAVGDITRINLVSDRSGRSTGKCYIDYARYQDAREAIHQFDNRKCGPEKLIVTMAEPLRSTGLAGRLRDPVSGHRDRDGGRSGRGRNDRDRRDGGNGQGGGRKQGGESGAAAGTSREKRRGPATAEQLDAELEAYLNAKESNTGGQDGAQSVPEPALHAEVEGMQVD